MASPAVTYTFTNSTTADATQVNQNFSDLIAGMTDGSKSFSIDALTVSGACLLNGTVGLGNATADDITFTGYVASAITPKTDDTYDLGTAALAWQDLYLDGALYTDTISELGSGVGVTVDSVLLKDAIVNCTGGIVFGGGAVNLNYYETYSVALNGDFGTGINLICERIGRVVHICFGGVGTHASLTVPSTSVGLVPTQFRPSANAYNAYVPHAGGVNRMEVLTNGAVLCEYFDWAGSAVATTNTLITPYVSYIIY